MTLTLICSHNIDFSVSAKNTYSGSVVKKLQVLVIVMKNVISLMIMTRTFYTGPYLIQLFIRLLLYRASLTPIQASSYTVVYSITPIQGLTYSYTGPQLTRLFTPLLLYRASSLTVIYSITLADQKENILALILYFWSCPQTVLSRDQCTQSLTHHLYYSFSFNLATIMEG